jgi:hypothetical protein
MTVALLKPMGSVNQFNEGSSPKVAEVKIQVLGNIPSLAFGEALFNSVLKASAMSNGDSTHLICPEASTQRTAVASAGCKN